MIPGVHSSYDTSFQVSYDKAILAGGMLNVWNYRTLFDVSIPVYSSGAHQLSAKYSKDSFRPYLLVSSQQTIHPEYKSRLRTLEYENNDILLLEKCTVTALATDKVHSKPTSLRCNQYNEKFSYPDVLMQG